MIIQILLLTVGLTLLIKGADWLVDGAATLAKKYRISNLTIGLTIVAFGTSAPELVVNSFASYNYQYDIVLGNIIGSNNFNLFFILGIAGIITPLVVQSSTVWKEIPISFFAILILFGLANNFFVGDIQVLSKFDGIILAFMFAAFLFYIYNQLKSETNVEEDTNIIPLTNTKIWIYIIVGLSFLVLGGKMVIDNSVLLAETLGVSKKIIGLTIIAAGTSLPELATSVVAAIKKNNDIAVGNIIGSNIFNIFLILSISTLIEPIKYNDVFNQDLYFLAGGTIFLFVAMFTGTKKKLDRWEAAILLISFLIYTFILISKEL